MHLAGSESVEVMGSDVKKHYQQCASLTLLALGEAEHGLYGAFIVDLVEEWGLSFFESYLEWTKSLGSLLGTMFLKCLNKKNIHRWIIPYLHFLSLVDGEIQAILVVGL
jgi:hypothetical protein